MMGVVLLLKVTILLAVGLAAVELLPKREVKLRHAVCVLTVAAALLLPLWVFVPATAAVRSPFVFSVSASARVTEGPVGVGLGTVWLVGFVLVLVRFLAGVAYMAWKTRRAKAFAGDVRLGDVDSPVVWGWFRPTILMPAEALAWSKDRWRLALAHERAHIARGDVWTATLAALAEAVYWFHPLIWMVSARMREEQELACDEKVLEQGNDGFAYAELLLETATRPVSQPFGCRMTGGAMKKRVKHIVGFDGLLRWNRTRRWLGIAVCSVCLAAGALVASADEGPYKIGGDVSSPKVISKQEPKYTKAARKAKASGVVVLSIVVTPDGKPEQITVIKSLRKDLDQNAIKAVSMWRFEPGRKQGQPVPVMAHVEVNFRLL
jgi:TonB family protein